MRALIKKIIISITALLFLFIIAGRVNADVTVKLKDISYIEGLKYNQVYGYGLVVGLQGTGDTKSSVTTSSLKNLLKNLGMEGDDIVSKNTAAVLITAQLPPFVRVGDRIDVTVSSIGDARSLEGGILVQSQLKGADDRVYVAAQGHLALLKPGRASRGTKTVAHISNGGLVERGITPEFIKKKGLNIVLKNSDFTTASIIIREIAGKFPASKPDFTDSGIIRVSIVDSVPLHEFISQIENIEITPSMKARVVINERSGTIVTGGDVRISKAMVSRNGMTIEIAGTDKKGSAAYIKDSASVKDLVDVMNSIGASTGDIIAMLKALKEAGALHGELIVK